MLFDQRTQKTYPGWRDFERATAAVIGGINLESKAVFDVLVPVPGELPYGLSLKTSAVAANAIRVRMELTNASAKITQRLNTLSIDPGNDPTSAGIAIIELIEEWHLATSSEVEVERSSYLVLTHNTKFSKWQLFWYDLNLRFRNPQAMNWSAAGKRIAGHYGDHLVWEWYGQSGGQVKYYPLLEWARWYSHPFELSEPPIESPASRAQRYWPEQWP
jgi:hypothetical protein